MFNSLRSLFGSVLSPQTPTLGGSLYGLETNAMNESWARPAGLLPLDLCNPIGKSAEGKKSGREKGKAGGGSIEESFGRAFCTFELATSG